MHNAPAAARPSHATPTLRRPGAPARPAQALLAAWARTVRRVWPSQRTGEQSHAGAADNSEETAMHSPCL
jgi:hypothetical protein